MATKRMFSKQIVDSDAFLDMPMSSQLLYFHLVMRADDEGFVGNPKKIMRMIGIQDDDFKVLLGKRFILAFESGVIVIKHWLIHNTIRMDRFNETSYKNERNMLITKENKAYSEHPDLRQPSGNQLEPQVKLSKVNLIKERGITPAEATRDFFKGVEDLKYQNTSEEMLGVKSMLAALADKYSTISREKLWSEILKFHSYWTELNASGTRQRWQKQETFEVNRRLATWFARSKADVKNKYQVGKV